MPDQNEQKKSRDRGKNGKFTTGHAKKGGRKAGTPNAMPRDYQTVLLAAAAQIGSDGTGKDGLQGYFEWLGVTHPKALMPLLVKLIRLEYLQERVRDLERQLGINR